MNSNFYFNFSVSIKPYDRNKDDAAFIKWQETNGTVTTLSQYITEGFAYCNCFYHNDGQTFGNGFKKADNVKSANLICLDLDAVRLTYHEFVAIMEQTEIMPNIVYTTANNGKYKKPTETYNNRYRVIYVVDEPIYNNTLYKEVHQALKNEIRIITEDDNVYNDNTDSCVSHFFAGCRDTNITTDENIYPLSWLMERYSISSENEKVQDGCIYTGNGKSDTRTNNKGNGKVQDGCIYTVNGESATRYNNIDNDTKYHADVYVHDVNTPDNGRNGKCKMDVYLKKEKRVIYNDVALSDTEFLNDILTLPIEQIIIKYQNIYNTDEHTNIEFSNGELYKTLPPDYLEIRRKWNFKNMNLNGRQINISKPLKIKNGEGRRKTIFLNLILRKRINPNITIEHLLYNGLRELYYYIDNTDKDDVITTYEISRIAYEVFKTDINKWNFRANTKKFKINKEYCKKNGINARRAALQINSNNKKNEKQTRMEQMKRLYNKDITDQENIKVLNENGVNISLRTYKQYKKELGLSKTYNKRPTSDQKQKDNKVIDQQIISAERTQETPIKEESIKAQDKANKSVESIENASVEQIPMKEETSAERAKEMQITYNSKYPHLVYVNEMILFENEMEKANTIEDLERLKKEFEKKLKVFPQIPQTAEKVVSNSLKSTMAKYEKILESLINKA